MLRSLLVSVVATLALAPTALAAPDPERALDAPVGTGGAPFVGTDAKAMFKSVAQSGSRITTTAVRVVGGKPRFAIGYVADAGPQKRTWWWDPRVSESKLGQLLKSRNARLIDLEVYVVDGKRRLSAVSVANTGPAQKAWWWHPRRKRADLLKLTAANNARIVDLERSPSGLYDIITIANTGEDARAWWLLFGLNHGELRNAATSRNARFQDLEHTGKDYFFDLVLTQEERPKGWFFNTSDSATEAAAATRSFGARTSIIDFYVGPTGKRYLAHVGVTDIDKASEAARAALTGDSHEFETSSTFGALVTAFGGAPPLVSINPNFRHETASALKVLHHALLTRTYEQKKLPLDKPGDFAYRQYVGLPSCPLDNIQSKPVVQRSMEGTTADMMYDSDNGATATVLARVGGPVALTAYAKSLGVAVSLGKPLGCFDRAAPNLWTLNAAGRLYANIASGRVVSTEPYAKHLRIGFLPNGTDDAASLWRSAATTAGKAEAAALDRDVEFRSKGGSYGGGSVSIATLGGVLWLPVKVGGVVQRRPYYIGSFFDSPFRDQKLRADPLRALAPFAIADALATF